MTTSNSSSNVEAAALVWCCPGRGEAGGGGVPFGIYDGGVVLGSSNPDPISDQNI